MTQETRRDLRFPMLAAAVLAAACLGGLYSAWALATPGDLLEPATGRWVAVALLALGALVAELLDVAIPGTGSMSMSFPLCIATAIYAGPFYAGMVALISLIPALVVRRRSGWAKLAFNTGQVVLTAMAPALVYLALGGTLLSVTLGFAPIPGLVAGITGTVVNLGLSTLGISFLHNERIRVVWRSAISWMVPSQVALGFVGLAIGWVLGALGWQGFTLFVLPLLVARQTYQQSMNLQDAYADTIKSLVGALEAKDVYTKGHSVRVAEYTVMIAQSLQLDPDRIRRLEQAALLHDIGKVGVSRRVLAKEAKLTDDEYAEIKRHPDIGAHILADVPYLADLVPAIQNHHKRYDGGGYGGNGQDLEVPYDARILTVADSYDAMTSARPYRGAMTHEDAVAELARNSGGQFDPDIVAAFERGYPSLEAREGGSEEEPEGNEP